MSTKVLKRHNECLLKNKITGKIFFETTFNSISIQEITLIFFNPIPKTLKMKTTRLSQINQLAT